MTTIALDMKTTAIGSLPHHNVDAALGFSFELDIPFLPQIPMRHDWEYMIPQALAGLPGLEAGPGGAVTLDINAWHAGAHALTERLNRAFETDNYEEFEPSPSTSSCWKPFLFELEERGLRAAKVQIAGPLTSQWALRLSDGSSLDKYPDVSSQILRVVLSHALGMARKLQQKGITPILFVDEPALYVLTAPTGDNTFKDPRHMLALRELRLLIQVLRKNDVIVGLHCCSDTDWAQVLGLGLDILSLDAALSLGSLLRHQAPLSDFLRGGGRLSLGVIPTNLAEATDNFDALDIFSRILATLAQHPEQNSETVRKILTTSLLTPACGLALQSTTEAEIILSALKNFKSACGRYFERSFREGPRP